jgi:hypothetical protein
VEGVKGFSWSPTLKLSRQTQRAQERKTRREQKKLIKQLQLWDFAYVADDSNIAFSAMAPHIVDFIKVIGLPKPLKEHVQMEKRESPSSPTKLSQLLILQNILGYDDIASSRLLNLDGKRRACEV